jgi:hypothetical protein
VCCHFTKAYSKVSSPFTNFDLWQKSWKLWGLGFEEACSAWNITLPIVFYGSSQHYREIFMDAFFKGISDKHK